MARYTGPVCRLCRRERTKLFLKGERCYSLKCPVSEAVTDRHSPMYYRMIKKFEEKSGCPVIINTSFNVRGEPIVGAPEHAYTCFMRTNMDYLVLGNFLLEKKEQKPLDKDIDWLKEFELD